MALPNKPSLAPHQYYVTFCERNTGIVVTLDGERWIGEGDPRRDLYLVANSLAEARDHGEGVLRTFPDFEGHIYNSAHVEVETIFPEVKTYILEGSRMRMEADFHGEAQRVLGFFTGYGWNLNALEDVLRDPDLRKAKPPLKLIWKDCDVAQKEWPEAYREIVSIIGSADGIELILEKGDGSRDVNFTLGGSNAFLRNVELALKTAGHPVAAPPLMVDYWKHFVESCEEGYQWDVSEYFDEIRVRTSIEVVLTAPSLQQFSELEPTRATVAELDQRIRALFQEGVSLKGETQWWMQGVLKKAGEPYVQYFQKAHGIRVDLAEKK